MGGGMVGKPPPSFRDLKKKEMMNIKKYIVKVPLVPD